MEDYNPRELLTRHIARLRVRIAEAVGVAKLIISWGAQAEMIIDAEMTIDAEMIIDVLLNTVISARGIEGDWVRGVSQSERLGDSWHFNVGKGDIECLVEWFDLYPWLFRGFDSEVELTSFVASDDLSIGRRRINYKCNYKNKIEHTLANVSAASWTLGASLETAGTA